MFLPISDAPNPKGVPIATWAIISLNVALYLLLNLPLGMQAADADDPVYAEYVDFLAQQVRSRGELAAALRQVSAYDLFVFEHGYRPAAPSPSDLLFSMFLHGGLLHLAGNMLFLWIYGDNVERRLGPLPYLLAYLATGAAATLFHALVFSSSPVPLVGASGAISGVLGLYFVWFPRNVVRVLFFLPPFFLDVVEISARIVLTIYLLLDNLLPFLLTRGGGVAHGAHIGGFVAGAAIAWLMDRRRLAARPPEFTTVRRAPATTGEVREALAGGDWKAAADRFFALPVVAARDVLRVDEAVELARRLHASGRSEAALLLLGRTVRGAPVQPGLAEAYALAGFILLDARRDAAAAYQYLRTALQLGAGPETAAEIRRRLADIEALQKRRIGRLR